MDGDWKGGGGGDIYRILLLSLFHLLLLHWRDGKGVENYVPTYFVRITLMVFKCLTYLGVLFFFLPSFLIFYLWLPSKAVGVMYDEMVVFLS